MLIYRSVNQDYNFILEDDTRLYELNDAEKEWIENNKLIRIGVSDQTLPLLSWDKNGLPIGLFKDYFDFLAHTYEFQVEFISLNNIELYQKLMKKEIDAAITVYDAKLENTLEFTMPMVKTKGKLWIRDSVKINDSLEGEDLKILMVQGDPSYKRLNNIFPLAEFIFTSSISEIFEKSSAGEGNIIAGNEAAIYHFFGTNALENGWRTIPGYTYEGNFCLAIKEDNKMLFNTLNNIIYYMDNDKLVSQLQGKWFGLSYSLDSDQQLEEVGIIVLIVFAAVLCVFLIFYQSNKSLYEELQQRMELLIQSKNELQTTFDGVTHYIAELDLDGNVIDINKAFAKFLGINKQSATGKTLISLLDVEHQEKDKITKLINKTFSEQTEIRDVITTKKMIFEVHTFLIKDNKGKVRKLLIMLIDVTAARSAERQMLQDNKMIAIGQLAAGIAHEIRNPLDIIRNYCYVLKELDNGDRETKNNIIEVMDKSVDRASKIIDNLLNFSRISTNKKELINLRSHINSIIDLQGNLINNNNIQLHFEYSGPDHILIQVETLDIILVNLIKNSVDAITNDGIIKISCFEQDNNFILTIKDNGEGIPPDAVDEIFNPFFTTKKNNQGNGLGLYIVYNEVKKMGGDIEVETIFGKGTCFSIQIPIERE
jgi:PAS domain S-box-containing protein